MGVAAEQKVVAQGQNHVDVGLEHQPAQQPRERLLDRRWIQREQLFELVDDDEDLLVALAKSLEERDRRILFLESQERLHRFVHLPRKPAPAPGRGTERDGCPESR